MADDKTQQSPDVEPRHRILRMSGYAAATAFCAVSVGANLQYGLSLGKAYTDFCCWARALGIELVTETRFGRDFSTHIVSLGGAKVKRRDRAYYEGVSLTAHEIEISAPLRAAA